MAPPRVPIWELFKRNVKILSQDECWPWIGAVSSNGYGHTSSGDEANISSHRLSWELFRGPIPKGKWVLHRCDNRLCVNPNHLFIGTPADNSRDMVKKGRSYGGERHHNCKLTIAKVKKIRSLRKKGLSLREVANQFGISLQSVWRTCNGVSWNSVS